MAPEKTDPDDSVVSEEGGGSVVVGVVEGGVEGGHDPYFEPVVTLPAIVVLPTEEEQEEEMMRLRCKLFRYHTAESLPEWKERGTGDIKILRDKNRALVRLLMRQDKTLKIRANHYITPYMELKPNCGSDRAFVWSVPADFADEEPKQELFAARFANAENARVFRETFDEARGIATVAEVKIREEEEERRKEAEEEEEEEETSTSSTTSFASDPFSSARVDEKPDASESVTACLKDLSVKE